MLRASGLSRSSFFLVCLGVLFFLYLRRFLLNGAALVVTGDESLFWGRAVHVLHGQMIYRDFFELVSPGTELLDAAAFWMFGIHAWVIQAVAVAFGMTMFAVMTWIAGQYSRAACAASRSAVPRLRFQQRARHDTSLVQHAGCTVCRRFSDGWDQDQAGAVGEFLLRPGCSLYADAGRARLLCPIDLLDLAGAQRRRTGEPDDTTCGFYGAIRGDSCRGVWVLHSPCRVFQVFFDLVVFPVRYLTGEVNSPRTYLHQIPSVHSGGDVFRVFPYLLIYAIMPYVYLFGWWRLWTARRELPVNMRQRLVLLHLVGVALVLAVVTGPRFFRLSTVAPPALLVLVCAFCEPTRARKIARNFLGVVAAVFALVLSLHRVTQWHGVLNLPIGRTAFVERAEFDEFRWLAERTKAGDVFFNNTSLSLYLSLSTPVAAEFIDDGDSTRPDQVDAILDWLKQNPAQFIVMYPKLGSSRDDNHSELFRQFVKEDSLCPHVSPP